MADIGDDVVNNKRRLPSAAETSHHSRTVAAQRYY